MTDNLSLWNKLGRTDPSHTKTFKRAGGFGGTAIKPIYTTQKMTEVFGPAGKGWGMGEPTFQTTPGHNGEVLVYCTVSLWWADDQGAVSTVYGVGGDKVTTYIKPNEQYNRPERWENDDEAFKKAFTDAVGNAMKHLGMSADVHMGLFDDSKYVSELRNEIADQSRPPVAPPQPSRFQQHIAAMNAAGSLDDLQAAFLAAKADKTMTADEVEKVIARKDAVKAAFIKPTVPPNFDDIEASIPFGDGERHPREYLKA